ncbi:MAG TPA: twin-arginine translocation signal domain-containing protein, partial [Candidatus Acidoferrum sp.]|nr:twin-arginine translocation signal domain-containing protein [Candidatus Acidoferrum sp.]
MTHPRRLCLSRRQFLALSASATVLAAAPAVAQTRRGGTFISAKTTEAPSLDPIMEQALSRQRLDPLFYNRMVEWGF